MSTNPSILSHVSLGTNRFARAVCFYDQVLFTLGIAKKAASACRPFDERREV